MKDKLIASPLFKGMTLSDIDNCLKCSGSNIVNFQKDEHIFMLSNKPDKLFILMEDAVNICRDSIDGKRNIITTINKPGDLFGEVFLFIEKNTYDNYAVAAKDTTVLKMPKDYLYNNCKRNCGFHTLLISNMLSILAKKAYFLSQKLNIVSSPTLRQKICKLFLNNSSSQGEVELKMTREEMADYLNVARPSLSRELMKMQEEKMIEINKRKIILKDIEKIQNIF